MFIGMIMVPITLYLYLAHASWAWMYMIDPSDIPGFAILPLVVLHGAMIVAGWYLGARLIQAGRHKLIGYIALGAGLVSLVAVALLWGRLGYYGSYTEFHEGRALPIMDVKLGYVLVALLFAILASIAFMAVELIRDSRRAVSR
tara:strand:- start:194792 stop:195223 length:432 start_codon:yes stop_codon:yes gene_type:complete